MTKPTAVSSILCALITLGAFSRISSANRDLDPSSDRSSRLVAVASSAVTGPSAREEAFTDCSATTSLRRLIDSKPIRFASCSGELGEIGRRNLRSLVVPLLLDSASQTIIVEGHTDLHGSNAVNDRLGLRRAERVRDYLITIGVPAQMLVVRSAGARRPLVADRTAAAGRVNRRVEIRLGGQVAKER